MSFVLRVVLMSLCFVSSHAFANDDFYIDRLVTTNSKSAELLAEKQRKLERILQAEAKKILPGQIAGKKLKAATVIKPSLNASRSGMMLVLQRFDMGDLFSTIEVRDFANVRESDWSRVCSRAVRDLIYGNFRQPTPEPSLRPVASR